MEENTYRGDAVDEILRGPRRYVNLLIVAVNIILFVLVEVTGDSTDTQHMVRWGAAWLPDIMNGEYWRLFTCMFLHFGITQKITEM